MDINQLTTEQNNRDTLGISESDTLEMLQMINREDQKVALAVEKELASVAKAVDKAVQRMKRGGRMFYFGAGTSGRLGIVDASEIRPTYGVDNLFIGMMAGGDDAIRSAAEGAEDSRTGGWKDMQAFSPNENDVLIGIAASGTTPYVVGAVEEARRHRLLTGCITCNDNSPLAAASEIPVEVVVGPEFVTGSTRMKAGTAEKLVLNMISTASMIRLGHVKGNKMVDMQLTNTKLMDRGTRMIMDETGIKDYDYAHSLLLAHGSVRAAITAFQSCPTDSSHPTQP